MRVGSLEWYTMNNLPDDLMEKNVRKYEEEDGGGGTFNVVSYREFLWGAKCRY
jgi:hypothetical protein